jgi:hypothetical protein
MRSKILETRVRVILIMKWQKKKKKRKNLTEDWWSGSSGKSSYLTSIRPLVQTPVPSK